MGHKGLVAALAVAVIAGGLTAQAMYRQDINADGEVGLRDALTLLLIGRANPEDSRIDFNGDGEWTSADVIDLLTDIREGNLTPLPAASPRIALSVESLAFGEVDVGGSDTLSFDISNEGDTTLIVTGITSSDAAFSASPDSLAVEPDQSGAVDVIFSPSATGEISAVLSILSNDPETDSLTIALSGTGADTTTVNVTHDVTMPGNVFSPDTLTIAVGDTVLWDNTDSAPHTVTSGEGGTADGIFDSGNMDAGDTYSFVFTEAGNFPYYCVYHYTLGMVGMIIVE